MDQQNPIAKVFFLQLGIIVALYTAIVSFITFGFNVINYIFPDRQAYAYDPYSTSLRFSISILIVVFPVLIYLSRLMWKMLRENVSGRDLLIRKWLSYLTLFLTGAAIIVDLIALVNTFLNGEINDRFISKVTLVLIVAFGVFWYTIRDLKGVYFERPQLLRLFTIIASVIVLGSLIGGLMIVGSPASQRKLRDDMTRTSHLQSIQWDVVSFYQRTGKMPNSIDELVDPLYPEAEERFKDPETGEKYEYKSIASSTPAFELCATFALDSKDDYYKGRGEFGGIGGGVSRPMVDYYYPDMNQNFEHTAGRNCFTRSIDPKRYPVYPPTKPGEPIPL